MPTDAGKKKRKPLTDAQREAKNKKDRERRAAKKAAEGKKKSPPKTGKKKKSPLQAGQQKITGMFKPDASSSSSLVRARKKAAPKAKAKAALISEAQYKQEVGPLSQQELNVILKQNDIPRLFFRDMINRQKFQVEKWGDISGLHKLKHYKVLCGNGGLNTVIPGKIRGSINCKEPTPC